MERWHTQLLEERGADVHASEMRCANFVGGKEHEVEIVA